MSRRDSKRDEKKQKQRRPLDDSAGFGGTLGDLLAARGLAPAEPPAAPPEAAPAPPSASPTLADCPAIRVHVDRKGRRGKVVTLVDGVDALGPALDTLARDLRRHLACGVTARDGQLIIQGDHSGHLIEWLRARGARVTRTA
ncbi:MAG: translation initiation factor [Myxococcales bacterium]|nr:translation initiation factor [Myxococcales bacterium]